MFYYYFFSDSGQCYFLRWPRSYCSYLHTGRNASQRLPSREKKTTWECLWSHHWTADHTVPRVWFLRSDFSVIWRKKKPSFIWITRFRDNLFLSHWLGPYFWLLPITHGTNDKTIFISLWFHWQLTDKIQDTQLNLNFRQTMNNHFSILMSHALLRIY